VASHPSPKVQTDAPPLAVFLCSHLFNLDEPRNGLSLVFLNLVCYTPRVQPPLFLLFRLLTTAVLLPFPRCCVPFVFGPCPPRRSEGLEFRRCVCPCIFHPPILCRVASALGEARPFSPFYREKAATSFDCVNGRNRHTLPLLTLIQPPTFARYRFWFFLDLCTSS